MPAMALLWMTCTAVVVIRNKFKYSGVEGMKHSSKANTPADSITVNGINLKFVLSWMDTLYYSKFD